MKTWFTALATAAAIAATPASAAIITFDLSATPFTTQGSNAGNAFTYRATGGGSTVNVRVSAFSYDPKKAAIATAKLERFTSGLGVTASGDGDGSNNRHTIDNQGTYDFVAFQFDQIVTLESAVLNAFTVSGSAHPDNDAYVAIGNVAAWNRTLSFGGANGASLAQSYDVDGTGSNSPMLNPNRYAGNLVLIGASRNSRDGRVDGFKLDDMRVATAVPEPASWAMMLAGFGLVGGAVRRTRRDRALALA